MNKVLQVSLIFAILIYFCILFSLIKRKSLDLKYALLWILCGIVMFIISLFPEFMIRFIKFFGIVDPINGLLALMLFFTFIILMALTGIVSKMKYKNKYLIQECALLEKRIRELEKNKKHKIEV